MFMLNRVRPGRQGAGPVTGQSFAVEGERDVLIIVTLFTHTLHAHTMT